MQIEDVSLHILIFDNWIVYDMLIFVYLFNQGEGFDDFGPGLYEIFSNLKNPHFNLSFVLTLWILMPLIIISKNLGRPFDASLKSQNYNIK